MRWLVGVSGKVCDVKVAERDGMHDLPARLDAGANMENLWVVEAPDSIRQRLHVAYLLPCH